MTAVGVAGHDGASSPPDPGPLTPVTVDDLLAGAQWHPRHLPRPPSPRPYDPPRPRSWAYDPNLSKPSLRHLVKRFVLSIRPGRPSPSALAWADSILRDGERALFHEMAGYDQRHAIGVGRLAARVSGSTSVGRAALLHDVGKVDCRLGPIGRSLATLARVMLPVTAEHLSRLWLARVLATPDARLRPGTVRERFAAYWTHPWTGRRMLDQVDADPDVAAWAEHHHHCYVAEELRFSWNDATLLWELDGD